jgi:hypothetical protein
MFMPAATLPPSPAPPAPLAAGGGMCRRCWLAHWQMSRAHSLDGDIKLVCQAQAHDVEHGDV